MLRIYTTPTGRQTLLSNLEIRNVLYNKYLTIMVQGEDQFDKEGNILPAEMMVYRPDMNRPEIISINNESLDKINEIIKETF